ncbi:MAG: hypothetical protein COA62_02380 [Rhodobiaceae bacterium]|nr:MAG: hypothetical protein COA62_02380 [Rhodobiaceae bacterium]
MSDDISTPSGFSRVVLRDDVPAAGLRLKLDADSAACAVVAERLGLLSIDSLSTQVEVFPWRKMGLTVEGTFSADVTQACVVSLEPVQASLSQTFVLRYRPLVLEGEGNREVAVNPLEDEPENLPEAGIDLGEIVAEQLVLALDPYPKAPEHVRAKAAHKPMVGAEDVGSSETLGKKDNPFDVLKNFKLNGDK